MSAKVQLNLEKRLPELRAFEKRNVFSGPEIAEIVRRFTACEAALVRQGTQVKDILDYVEYERKLDRLRDARVKRLSGSRRRYLAIRRHSAPEPTLTELQTVPPAPSDLALRRHILALFSRGTRRFSSSLDLWQQYIAFTLSGPSSKAASTALTGAIAAHPHCARFWIFAARFEADGHAGKAGGNVDGARKLLMRGLRFNRSDTSLWIEWLRIEVGFAERMRARWTASGVLTAMTPSHRAPDESVRLPALEGGLDEAEEAMHATVEAQASPDAVDDGGDGGRRALVDGALAKLVISNALAAGTDEKLPLELVDMLRSLPASSSLREPLMTDVYVQLAQVASTPTIQLLVATRPFYGLAPSASASDQVEALALAASALQHLLAASPAAARLRELSLDFLVDRHAEALLDEHAALAAFLAGHATRQWQSALALRVATPALARSRLRHLEAQDAGDNLKAVAEARSVLGEVDRPQDLDLHDLEAASDQRNATIDAHLAFLTALVTAGRATEVPVRLKRIQGRLRPDDARDLEARWVTEMT